MLLLQHVSTTDGHHQGDPVRTNWTKHIPVLNYIKITLQYTNKIYRHQLQFINSLHGILIMTISFLAINLNIAVKLSRV